MHPTGQIPAYEWNFSDVNPPVHAWAALFLYRMEQALRGKGDLGFLKRIFRKLAAEFPLWVNRKDRFGRTCSKAVSWDWTISAFSTAARRCRPAVSGAGGRHRLDGAVLPEHARDRRRTGAARPGLRGAGEQIRQALSVDRLGNECGRSGGMWDEEDGFYYDVLRLPDGSSTRLKVRSMVGLLPLCAITVIEKLAARPDAELTSVQIDCSGCRAARTSIHGPRPAGVEERGISVWSTRPAAPYAARMLDEDEFLSPYGLRSLSRYHPDHPYVFRRAARSIVWPICRPSRIPACSAAIRIGAGPSGCRSTRCSFGRCCNSTATTATSSKSSARRARASMNLFEVAREIANRLTRIFLRDATAAVRSLADRRSSRRSALADICCSTNTSMATTAPDRRQPPDRMDRAGGHTCRALRQTRCRGSADGVPPGGAGTGAVEKLTPVRF